MSSLDTRDPLLKATDRGAHLREIIRTWNEAIDAAINIVAIFQSKDVQPIIDELIALKRKE